MSRLVDEFGWGIPLRGYSRRLFAGALGIALSLAACRYAPGEEPSAPFRRSPLVESQGAGPTYEDVNPDGVLVGLRVTVAQLSERFDCVHAIQPIYRLKDSKIVRGKVHGHERGVELVSEAKPGYVVGQIIVSHGHVMDGIRCVFMRERDGKLDPTDRYEGRMLGARNDLLQAETTLEVGDRPAIGIYGNTVGNLRTLGLLLPPAATEN